MPRKQRKYHFIYKIVCSINGKYYIGMHSTDNLEDGYLGSGKRLRYSRNKHGDENHIREVLEFCKNREELSRREREIVCEELLDEELCMNLIVGGHGGRGFTSEEQKLNNKKSQKKQRFLIENDKEWVEKRKNNLSKARKEFYAKGNGEIKSFYNWSGKKHSEETKKKMSESSKDCCGGKNSQFGTCWITKDGQNKKIKKEELVEHEKEGWIKGRKI